MIGSPFSLLLISIFIISLLSVVFFIVFSIVRIVPKEVRSGMLYLATFLAAIGASAMMLAQPMVGQKIQDVRENVSEINVEANSYPYYSIAQIYKSNGLILPCSGTLISDSLILTSARCLTSVSSKNGFTSPEEIIVKFPNRPSEQVQSYVVGPHFNIDARKLHERVIGDWAIITLSAPIKDRTPLAIQSGVFKNEAFYVTAGYAGAPGTDIQAYKNCTFLNDQSFNFFLEYGGEEDVYINHICAQWEIASGAPYLIDNGQARYEVAAIQTTYFGSYGTRIGVAVPASAIDFSRALNPHQH